MFRSYDVGSMFLMDLSVNESDISNGHDACVNAQTLDYDSVFPQKQNFTQDIDSYSKVQKQQQNNNRHPAHHRNDHYHNFNLHNEARHNNHNNHRQDQLSDSLSTNNSLDRLTDVINGIQHSHIKTSSTITTLKPRPHPHVMMDNELNGGSIIGGQESTSSSLSDEQFVGSSSTITSSSGASSCNDNDAKHDMHSLSSEASYEGRSSGFDINPDRTSTTTREDSGVLDIKDLVGSQKSEDACKSFEGEKHLQQINFTNHDNIQISNNINATNLINNNKSANIVYYDSHATTAKPVTNPTNNNSYHQSNNNNHHHNHHHNSNQGSKRSISASLPIEVPTRQIKKNLNKLKLGLISKNVATPVTDNTENQDNATATASTNSKTSSIDNQSNDDFDEFLEQEYNENHHNHYPMYEHEHLRADQDPMKLFESIQALARSLHEDAELFGSLPPKRMLESPIRSLALV